MSKAAVFVDRDGTLIEDVDFLTSPEQLRILPNTVPGLARLHEAGYAVIVVTNQSAVARGMLTEEELQAIHEQMIEHVATLGGHLDAVLYCPHLPDGKVARYAVDCNCRKPKPGLFYRAREELEIDLERSFAVGDAWRDVEAALAAGIPSVKLPRPPGREEKPRPDLPVLAEARNLAEAAEKILATSADAAREKIRHDRARAESGDTKARERGRKEGAAPSGRAGKAAPMPGAAEKAPESAPRKQQTELRFEGSPAETRELAESQGERDFSDVEPIEESPGGTAVAENAEIGTEGLEVEADERSAGAGAPEEAWPMCTRCGTGIDPGDLASGAAGPWQNNLLCRNCLAEVGRLGGMTVRRGTGEQSGDTEGLVREILTEVRRMSRRRSEAEGSFDLTRVMAMVAQAAGVFLVIVPIVSGRWDQAVVWLLAAIFVQLVALTLFMASQRKG